MIYEDNPIYAHAVNSRYVTCEYACMLMNKDLKHVLEFGVFEGKSLRKIVNMLDDSFKIYGFDSFVGLPENWEETICHKGFFNLKGHGA